MTAVAVVREACDGAGHQDISAAHFSHMKSQLAGGGEERRCAMAALKGNFLRDAFDAQGCRVAQAALDVAGREEQAQFAAELHGHVREALRSPHANYVVQKVVEVLPPALVAFVVEELAGAAVETASHCFGCRALCRLLEHCPHDQTARLVDELLQEGRALCKNTFGNHVVRQILEHGTPEQRKAVAGLLVKEPLALASHKTASCVVEAALRHCAAEDQGALAEALMVDADAVGRLACARYGFYVVRALLGHPGLGAEARARLEAAAPALQKGKFGRHVLGALA